MKNHALLSVIILLLIMMCACDPAPETATVTEVIDGDTITINTGHTVRYIGIDTPELHPVPEAYGMQAWQANREMVEGKTVRLEKDTSETDKYGRSLRYVYVNDTLVNAELVKLGLAEAKSYPPDTKYQDLLERLESEARHAGRGIWAR